MSSNPLRIAGCTCHPDAGDLLRAEINGNPIPPCPHHDVDAREKRARVDALEEAVAEMRASNQRAAAENERTRVGLADVVRFGLEHGEGSIPLNAPTEDIVRHIGWGEPYRNDDGPLDAA